MYNEIAQVPDPLLIGPCSTHRGECNHALIKSLLTLKRDCRLHALCPAVNAVLHISWLIIAVDFCHHLIDQSLRAFQASLLITSMYLFKGVKCLFVVPEVSMHHAVIQKQIDDPMIYPGRCGIIKAPRLKCGVCLF